MKIYISRTRGLPQNIVKSVIHQLIPFSGPLQFIEIQKPLLFKDNFFEWENFFEVCTMFRVEQQLEKEDFLVVLTELKDNKNWFSACDENGSRSIFIKAKEWENYIYCEPIFPIIYEIVANIFQCILDSLEIGHTHDPPIGCMNDMCSWKPDISFKLRTADICQDCQKLLLTKFSNEYLVQGIEIFESIRKKMVFNSNYQKNQSFEENLPFTIAITKRKLGMTTEPFRKLLMLIDHFDSIIRTSVIIISHLIYKEDEVKSFFINNNLSGRPSLGHWVKAFANLVNDSKSKSWDINLPVDFSNKLNEVIKIANEGKIELIRNEQRGHGYIDCHDNSYKGIFAKTLPILEEMEKLLSPLFYRFKFYHIINQSKVESNLFRFKIHNLSGSNPAFLEEEISSNPKKIESIPIQDHVYFVSQDLNDWHDLTPYLLFRECPLCLHNRLLIYDGIYLLDPYIGHRFEID